MKGFRWLGLGGLAVAFAVAACDDDPAEDNGEGGASGGAATGGAPGEAGAGGGPSKVLGCPEPTGEGTLHDSSLIESDETWTAEDSPHYVTTNLAIRGATVTIEKCAVVVLSEGVSIEVGDSSGPPGELVTRGVIDEEHEQPVVFTAESDDVYWRSIWIDPTGSADLEGTILRRGGDVNHANDNGVIVLYSVGELPVQKRLRMVSSAIVEAAGFGVYLGSYVGFTDDSKDLVIEDVGREEPAYASTDTRYPIFTTTAGLATIPSGEYTGNHYDAISVDGGTRYPADVTIRDRGVPYDFLTDLHIEPDDETPITLTLEAGVTLRFRRGHEPGSSARFAIDLGSSSGTAEDIGNPRPVRVVAEGTKNAPITLTSSEAEPAPGDWIGVMWAAGPSDGNVMKYVEIEYAGADSGANGYGCGGPETNAALIVRTWKPSHAFVENSTFAHSAGGGILCGWNSATDGPDLTANNTFEDIDPAYCEVTRPMVAGDCPEGERPICY